MNNPMLDPDALAAQSASRSVSLNRVYNFVYGWMAAALAVSGVVAWMVANAVMAGRMTLTPGLVLGCAVAEVALVFVLSAAVMKLAPAVAALLFVGYAALNGVTLSVLLLVYARATVQTAFFVAAGTFAAMAIVGTTTRRNLSSIGRYALMALIGVIIASLVNLFMRSTGLDAILSYVAVAVFVGLTAWDAQRVRRLAEAEQSGELDAATVNRLGLLFALSLYLDFVNLFIYLLRILGRNRE